MVQFWQETRSTLIPALYVGSLLSFGDITTSKLTSLQRRKLNLLHSKARHCCNSHIVIDLKAVFLVHSLAFGKCSLHNSAIYWK